MSVGWVVGYFVLGCCLYVFMVSVLSGRYFYIALAALELTTDTRLRLSSQRHLGFLLQRVLGSKATTLNNRLRFGISFSNKILLCLSVVVLNPGSSCWTFLSVGFTNMPPHPELYLASHLDLLVDSFLVREVFPVTRVHLTWLQEEMRNSEGRAKNTKFCPSFIYALPCNLAQFFSSYPACSPFWRLRRHAPVP